VKTAIYIRTSTKEQEPENQLDACMQLNTWGAYEVFKDQQSAWKDNKERDDFNKLLALIKKGQVSHLIVWDLDRLYRNRLKLVEFFKLCKAYKCTIHSVRQAWLEDITKMPQPWNEIVFDLALNIMGWIGEEESSKKSDRVKKATRHVEGQTMSYKGNKWGRRGINKAKTTMLLEALARRPRLSIRKIAEETKMSVGTVHKYISKFQAQQDEEKQRLAISQFTNDIEGGRLEKVYANAFERIFRNEGWVELAKEASNPSTRTAPLNKEKEVKKDMSTETPQSDQKEDLK